MEDARYEIYAGDQALLFFHSGPDYDLQITFVDEAATGNVRIIILQDFDDFDLEAGYDNSFVIEGMSLGIAQYEASNLPATDIEVCLPGGMVRSAEFSTISIVE